MTPRRSSRARTSQPSPALLQHTNSSSSSSNSLTRERSTRSNNKNHSSNESTGHRSQSIEDAEGGSKDLPHTRQRQRAHDDDDDPPREEDEDDLDDDEEEVTRCLCGQQEYPGLPFSRREALGRGTIKLESGQVPTDPSDPMSDDIGSMFIQCDLCKVWQHGGCVGIMDEATSPDEYFCEECRKDLHKIIDEPHGQQSSTYLPVAPEPVPPPPPPPPPAPAPAPVPTEPEIPDVPVMPAVVPSPGPSSRASSREISRRSRDSKSRNSESAAAHAKRRSTMNSRDAAYDEEELIRRAIEESKAETKSNADETDTNLGKRSRSDSVTERSKRPRTTSSSPSSVSRHSNIASHPPSDDEMKPKPAVNGARRQRAASRGQLEKDSRNEHDEAETEAPGAANRRKERSNRRKGDESEQEIGSPNKTAPPEPEQSQASPNTPTPQEPTPVRPSTRKSGRPPARRGRVGRNQYTKDRDTNGNGDSVYMANSPRRGQSHEIGGDSPRVGYSGVNGAHLNGGESGRPSKPRHMHPQRTTMNEMKRRVAAILEFISRMQVEMAVASENSSTPTGNGDRAQGLLLKSMVDQIDSAMPSTRSDGGESGPATTDGGYGESLTTHDRDFKELSSVEMMDVLTRHLLKWQQEYGKFGER
ncbi:Transcriptional regulator (Cti6), putative [Penicillium digitatum]|uniref:Transcriptional regulator (Cti6), putative n=1 Tax=Penicillium digitatum TaxID=36651 RepID=A0A7T7BKM3_PENDI|nr:Transcriptional regulator (Cti6), putative [Penicillium digitatum]